MATEVKICGLKTKAALEAALESGAAYIGLVFYAPSPRNVDVATARRLADLARGRAKVVALFVDPEDTTLEAVIGEVRPDLIQLHGSETPERVAAVAQRFGLPVVKAVKVEAADDAAEALRYKDVAALILFDAKPPAGDLSALPGGNGLAFNWRALAEVGPKVRFMLSGGLTPDTVAEAIRLTGAAAVDVSSGVESSPGVKDEQLIRRFLQAAKTAKQVA